MAGSEVGLRWVLGLVWLQRSNVAGGMVGVRVVVDAGSYPVRSGLCVYLSCWLSCRRSPVDVVCTRLPDQYKCIRHRHSAFSEVSSLGENLWDFRYYPLD